MAWFRRKRRDDGATPPRQTSTAADGTGADAAAPAPEAGERPDATTERSPAPAPATGADATSAPTSADPAQGAPGSADPELGPFDRAQIDDDGGYVDLGAVWVPGFEGLMLTMEVDETTGDVTAVRVHHGDSLLQLQAFAAPKSSGIWDEIREELVAGVTGQGGSAETSDGRFGTEVLARIPGRGADGRTIVQPMRFVGVDGPRWFLRGVLSGPAASDPAVAAPLLDLFSLVVVVRGDEPMAPRELLPLQLPAQEPAPEPAGQDEAAPSAATGTDDLRPFERGPEMTETR
ncbi:DUF3710 domain-containing protein [Agilicoccus flavus]|uniref:DUF3710 domain-containing protein n=1 Tax=Agilicoccus flavus TaxID=2775968 RepID=UPI001CF6DB8F|nr:DUF3710 domain-containing protein [Agilicoccus flavus]